MRASKDASKLFDPHRSRDSRVAPSGQVRDVLIAWQVGPRSSLYEQGKLVSQ
jgi:hypothetical protein